ncbi:MAG: polysaccharide biosynthesis/export family protein [Moraxellaceae bacterium]|nr:polysaccharide biosynthesis/export family protein [Moraxellaceae bacterium]
MRRLLWLFFAGLLASSASAYAETSPAGWWERLFVAPAASSAAPAGDSQSLPSAGASATAGAAAEPVQTFSLSSDYKLGPGDRLGVTVFNEKELSLEVRLSDAGTLSYPLLGEIRAQGMTIGMLKQYLTDQLKSGYLINPQVYVTILEYRQFFVNGEVSKPGGFPYQPGLTVRKAISLAGGLTPRASQTKIFVIHEDDPTGSARQVTLDTVLRPGDILTIEQSFF